MFVQTRSHLSASKKATVFWAVTGFHILLLLFILLICDVKYEVSDDFVMELILSGAYTGTPDPHIMFSNIVWGAFLSLFYQAVPGISWYFWSQIAVCFLSALAISYVLLQKQRTPLFLLIFTIFFTFSAKDMYLLVQFTKTATIAVMAGGLLFLWGILHEKKTHIRVYGICLFVVGTLIRFYALFIALPFLFLYFIYETAAACRERKKELFARLKQTFFWCVCLLLFTCGLRLLDTAVYSSNEEYSYFRRYSAVRAELVDYPLPEYEQCEAELSALNFSKNDYELLVNWGFGDDSVYSLEKLEQVASVIKAYRRGHLLPIRSILKEMLARRYVFYPGALCCLLIGLMYLALSRKQLWVPFSCLAWILIAFFYFISEGRCVYRVEFGFFFCAACICAVSLESVQNGSRHADNLQSNIPHAPALSVLLSVILVCIQCPFYLPDNSYRDLTAEEYRAYVDDTFYYSWNYNPAKYTKVLSKRGIRTDFLELVKSTPDSLYLLDFNTTIQTLYYDFSPFRSLPDGSLNHMLYLGGVTVHHPALTHTLALWGFTDMLPALLHENVYLVSNMTSDLVLEYLQSHYDSRTVKTFVATSGGYDIWKYTIE